MAQELGATDTIDLSAHGPQESVRELVSGVLGHDGGTLVIEVSGNPAAVDLGMELLARGGRMVVVGAVVQGTSKFNLLYFIRRGISMYGMIAYTAPSMLEGLRFVEGTIDEYPFKKLNTKTYRLEELKQALTDMMEKRIIKGAVRIAS